MTIPSAIVSTSDISISIKNSSANRGSNSKNILYKKSPCDYVCRNLSSVRSIKQTIADQKRRNNLLSLFETKSFQHHFQPNSTILLHGDPIEEYYMIVSGIVRCCTINPEGARQIFHFAKKGEFIGISDIDTWHFTAEAVDHVILKSIPHAQMKQALAKDIKLWDTVREQVCSHLENRERQLLSMVSAKTPERLYNFLCEFASSRPGTGYITLPMCRRDIADHLGLSVETVSRTFSELKRKGRIDLAGSAKYKICAETRSNAVTEHAPHFT